MAESLSYQQQQVANEVDQTTQNLSEETKNWASFGICLSDTLMPVLRQCIERRFRLFYEHLKTKNYQVNTNQNRLSADSAGRCYGINYIDSIKRNELGAHIIRDHHQLAQCFIYHYDNYNQKYVTDRHMIKFVQITDEAFDASAALTVLANASSHRYEFDCFGTDFFNLVKELKTIRNDWGHAKLSSFTTQKYQAAIQKMIQLLNSLPTNVTITIASQKLKEWKLTSLQQGTFVKPEVLKSILYEFKVETENNKKLATNKVEKEEYLAFKCSILNEFKKYAENYLKLADNKVDKEEVIALKSFIETQLVEIPMLRDNLAKVETRVEDLEDQRKKERNPKHVSNLPPGKDNFCGRFEKLEEIENLLLADTENNNKVIAIWGLGGIGKTAISLQISNRLKEKFKGGTFWITADDNEKITSNLFEIALNLSDGIDADIGGEKLVLKVIDYIDKLNEKSLIVIDNLDSDQFPSLANKMINGRLLKNSKVSILITSRIQKNFLKPRIKSSNCTYINVDCLSLKEGIQFMKAKLESVEINQEVAEKIVDTLGIASLTLGPNLARELESEKWFESTNLNEFSILEVINELGGLPLALEQFTLYVNIFEGGNLQTHLKRLKAKKLEYCELDSEGETTDLDANRLNVKTTWLMNQEALTKENPRFQRIFDVISFLNPTSIPTRILDANTPGLPKEMSTYLGDDQFFIHKLTKYSLFSRADKERLIVHRMIQEVIKDIVLKEEGRLKRTLTNVDITLDFLYEQARKDSISGDIPTQNGVHFANQIETFRGKNVLDEEWLTSLVQKTNLQHIMYLMNITHIDAESESILKGYNVLMSSWPGRGAIWSKAPLPSPPPSPPPH